MRQGKIPSTRPGDAGDDEPFEFPEGVLMRDPRAWKDEEDEDVPFVPVCTLPEEEFKAACDRLFSDGIPWRWEDEEAPADGAGAARRFAIYVRKEDVAAAKEAIARPPDARDEREDEFDDQFYVRQGLCPKCREATLEPMPLTPGSRLYRRVSVTLGTLALGAVIFRNSLPLSWYDAIMSTAGIWVVVVLVLAGLVGLLPSHKKRCASCGWQPVSTN